MNISIHPLQVASVDLLLYLYQELRLPTTAAMLSVANGYYPSASDVLSTLDHYKDQPKVIEFVENNGEAIASAKNTLEEVIITEVESPQVTSTTNSFFGEQHKFVRPYQILKTVPMKSIEKTLSEALSKLLEEDLTIEINSIQELGEVISSDAEIKLRIKAASRF